MLGIQHPSAALGMITYSLSWLLYTFETECHLFGFLQKHLYGSWQQQLLSLALFSATMHCHGNSSNTQQHFNPESRPSLLSTVLPPSI